MREFRLLMLVVLIFSSIVIAFKWFHEKIECYSNWAICAVNAQPSSASYNDERIKIAILDSGIDAEKAQVNIVNRYSNEYDFNDILGHGTSVASIISSNGENKIKGIYPEALIYDVNILDEEGKTSVNELIKAIEWSINQNVDIINMSFGVENDNAWLHKAIKKAADNGIIIVASAGNTLGMYVEYPAKYKEVLSISAVDREMKTFKYAAKGKIDFVAPGVDIKAVKTGSLSGQENLSGTSFATAYATGLIARLLSENKINSKNYKEELKEYSHKINENGCDNSYGCGLLRLK